jgi:hypothetical protein
MMCVQEQILPSMLFSSLSFLSQKYANVINSKTLTMNMYDAISSLFSLPLSLFSYD